MKKAAIILVVVLGLVSSAKADVVIGSWQNMTDEGWIDHGNGLSITHANNTGKYSFVQNVVPGYDVSLRITQSGWNQNLRYNFQSVPGGIAAFRTNQLLSFTFSVPAAAETGSTSGYSQINAFYLNAQGLGWTSVPWSLATATGWTNNNVGGMPNFYFWSGAPARSQTVTINYSGYLSQIPENASYIEIIFASNNGGGAPNYFYMNDVRLSQIPEPSTMVLIGAGMLVGARLLRRRMV
ncbi:MAG: PEP-CTERM sorting domain-containing protein [Verrucomicrobiae bacterium]|nr:PEP-CTERM sorting domain-containing protein [Verrucomicrobiae bacterium]